MSQSDGLHPKLRRRTSESANTRSRGIASPQPGGHGLSTIPSRPTRTMQLPVRDPTLPARAAEYMGTCGTKNVLHRDVVVARTQAPDDRAWALGLFILEESAVKPFTANDISVKLGGNTDKQQQKINVVCEPEREGAPEEAGWQVPTPVTQRSGCPWLVPTPSLLCSKQPRSLADVAHEKRGQTAQQPGCWRRNPTQTPALPAQLPAALGARQRLTSRRRTRCPRRTAPAGPLSCPPRRRTTS